MGLAIIRVNRVIIMFYITLRKQYAKITSLIVFECYQDHNGGYYADFKVSIVIYIT